MRKILLGLFLLQPFLSNSQTCNAIPVLQGYTITTSHTNFVQGPGALPFQIETTPWVLKGGWYQYFFTIHYTGAWSVPRSISTPYNETIEVSSTTGYGPKWNCASSHWWGDYYNPITMESDQFPFHYEWRNYHWRRNYNGIFSAHILFHPGTHQDITLAFSHGENKNEKIGDYIYQNTVRPKFLLDPNNPKTFSGIGNDGEYNDCWDAYFAFLNANWLPYDQANDYGANYMNDLGPVAWPAAGYVDTLGNQKSQGLRHPSSIVYGDYVYIYLQDAGIDYVTPGFKVIRVLKSNVLSPNLYEIWCGDTLGWLPSLPAGFTKETAASYFATPGPPSKKLWDLEATIVRFAVAGIKNTNKFLGVECLLYENGQSKLAFRTSTDLIHWSSKINFYCQEGGWNGLDFKYPIFLRNDGETNTEIDENDFYVIGSKASDKTIFKLHFVRDLSVPSPFEITARKETAGTITSEAASPIKVFPNPTQNIVHITGSYGNNGYYTISLFNSTGERVRTIDKGDKPKGSFNYKISTASLTNGIYYIVISNENGPVSKLAIVKQ